MECTMCGTEAKTITVIDDETRVCNGCLDAFFTQCTECGEFWDDSVIEFFLLKAGRLICEHCREGFDDDEIVFDD